MQFTRNYIEEVVHGGSPILSEVQRIFSAGEEIFSFCSLRLNPPFYQVLNGAKYHQIAEYKKVQLGSKKAMCASSALQATGSFSLNDALSGTGTSGFVIKLLYQLVIRRITFPGHSLQAP